MPASLRVVLISVTPALLSLVLASFIYPASPQGALGIAACGSLIGSLLAGVWTSRSIALPIVDLTHRLRGAAGPERLDPDSYPANASREIAQLATALGAASQVSAALSRQNEAAVLNFAQRMAVELDARDPYSVGHSLRVSQLSVAIAFEAGLNSEDIGVLRVGAILHDIGKVGIPDVVLQKKGTLSWVEFAEVKKHPLTGKRLLEGIELCKPYLPIVELHHENQDGTGYPWGLKGDEIPVLARIVHIADAFDAMTSERPFRDPMTPGKAIETIKRHAGSQFDSALVEVFLKVAAAQPDLVLPRPMESPLLEDDPERTVA